MAGAPRSSGANPGKTRAKYAAPAFEKAADIIELLANVPGGLAISDIASNLGRSIGELFRLVVVMERRGFLRRDPATDRYVVAYKLLDLAFRATPAQHLTKAAGPVMEALAHRIGQSCHLVVANDGAGLVIARNENPGPRGFAVRLGASVDLIRSCSGHVILAFSDPAQTDRMLARAPGGPPKKAERARLEKILAEVREQGFDRRASPITLGVTDISYPIYGFDGQGIAALTTPFLELIDDSQQIRIDEACNEMADAARVISGELGWVGPAAASPAIEPKARRRRGKGVSA